MRRAHPTLLWGGALLIASAMADLVALAVASRLTWRSGIEYVPAAVPPTLFLVACCVFALGVGGSEGMVGRNGWARAILIAGGICGAFGGWFAVFGGTTEQPLLFGVAVILALLTPALLSGSSLIVAWSGSGLGAWRFAPLLAMAAGMLTVFLPPGSWPLPALLRAAILSCLGVIAVLLGCRTPR
ncbi:MULTISPECIES: hypothetical protein [unclassified Microbacterium]|uniref:hypothetical protein n=1 Tax=unclassified Microbacterium TaxID=2609290 RepID=UPI00365F8DE8